MSQWRPGSGAPAFRRLLCASLAAPLLILACSHEWEAYDPRLGAASPDTGAGAGTSAGGGAPDAGTGAGAGTSTSTGMGGGGGMQETDAGVDAAEDADAGPPPVTDGLVALYTFEEGRGATVHDVSNVAPPLDLTIQDPGAVAWPAGALEIVSPTLITSGGPATKVIERCQQTNELTLEAWFQPASLTLDGPARIVTNSIDINQRNFQLGQSLAAFYEARIRSTSSLNSNGSPYLQSPADGGHVKLELTHLLVTRDAAGVRRLYVNAVEVASNNLDGDFSNWDPTFPLLMVDELTGDRVWLGQLHRIAIYNRALSAAEVAQNHAAGP